MSGDALHRRNSTAGLFRAVPFGVYTADAMSDQSNPPPARGEDPLLKSARREMLAAATVWAIALIYTVGVCTTFGYSRKPESLTYVLGFPDWVFWGIVVPWGTCTLISGWFAFGFMTSEPLE